MRAGQVRLGAGDLRNPIVIEQATEAKSALGDVEYTWATYAERSAHLAVIAGGESAVAGKNTARQQRTYIMRFDPKTSAIADTMRALADGKVFGITAVFDPDGRRRWIQVELIEQAIATGGA